MTETEGLRQFLDVAAGRRKADLVIRHARIVDVFNHTVIEGSLAVAQGRIAGIGAYEGIEEIDAHRAYVIPGLVDSHVHIESGMVSPEQFVRTVLPCGTTTIIADPHEIANVSGMRGIKYMLDATRGVPMHVWMMLPSCVPATGFEHSGASIDAQAIESFMGHERILGLGEMMDYPGVVNGGEPILEKLMAAKRAGKLIDGHSPMLEGKDLNTYAAAGIRTDHECSTVDEMRDRLSRGMYVLIREGSAARNLADLIRGVSGFNSRRCLFCTDDRQPEDIIGSGHIDNHLRLAVKYGIDPITAVQMATINAAECYGLTGYGAIAPGYQADFLLVDDLEGFRVRNVYVAGKLTAKDGRMTHEISDTPISPVSGTMHVRPFGIESLALPLESDLARVIRVAPHSLVTENVVRKVHRDEDGYFTTHENLDLLKLVVIERHHETGSIGLGIVENYRLTGGAVATTIAHDSHNIIAIGDNDEDIYCAVNELIAIGGGITLCADGVIIESLPLPIGGLMTNESAAYVKEKLDSMHGKAHDRFGINPGIDPFMTLSFLSLPVIPDLKLTDMGLFDVREFRFTPISIT